MSTVSKADRQSGVDFLHQLITDISDEKTSVISLSHKFGKPFAPRMGHRPEHSVLTMELHHRPESPEEKLSRLIHATKNEELIEAFAAVKELNELVESAEESADDDYEDDPRSVYPGSLSPDGGL